MRPGYQETRRRPRVVRADRADPTAVGETYSGLFGAIRPIEETPEDCRDAVETLLGLLTNAHAMSVVYCLVCEREPLRFGELERQTGASPKVLSRRLKELVGAGLVTRRAYDEHPVRVEYELTPAANQLEPAFQFLYAWAARYGQR